MSRSIAPKSPNANSAAPVASGAPAAAVQLVSATERAGATRFNCHAAKATSDSVTQDAIAAVRMAVERSPMNVYQPLDLAELKHNFVNPHSFDRTLIAAGNVHCRLKSGCLSGLATRTDRAGATPLRLHGPAKAWSLLPHAERLVDHAGLARLIDPGDYCGRHKVGSETQRNDAGNETAEKEERGRNEGEAEQGSSLRIGPKPCPQVCNCTRRDRQAKRASKKRQKHRARPPSTAPGEDNSSRSLQTSRVRRSVHSQARTSVSNPDRCRGAVGENPEEIENIQYNQCLLAVEAVIREPVSHCESRKTGIFCDFRGP